MTRLLAAVMLFLALINAGLFAVHLAYSPPGMLNLLYCAGATAVFYMLHSEIEAEEEE